MFDVLSGSTLNINAGATHKVAGVQTLTKGADVTAATDLLVNIDGNIFDVAGATTIATIASKGIGTVIKLQFDAALTLTHDATNLVLPGGANITTAAGDEAEFYEYASADWRCTKYTKADGTAVIANKEFIIYVAVKDTSFPYASAVGDFPVAIVSATADFKFTFHVPNDFSSLTDAVVLIIPDATETIQWDVDTDFGAVGEASNANSDSVADDTLAVTALDLTEIDVSAALTGIAANDYVGMEVASDTTNILPVLMRIRYT